jgi:hypothetical protein
MTAINLQRIYSFSNVFAHQNHRLKAVSTNQKETVMKIKVLVFVLVLVVVGVVACPAFAAEEGHAIGANTVLFYKDRGVEIWTPDADNNWSPAIRLTADKLNDYADAPDKHTLVASYGDISVYKLSTGEWQINNGEAGGKIRVVVFDEAFNYKRQSEWNVFAE